MRSIDALRRERAKLAAEDAFAVECFSELWKGEESSWDALDVYVRWVVEFRALCVSQGLHGRSFELAAQRAPDVGTVTALHGVATAAREVLAALGTAMGWPERYVADATLTAIRERADGIATSPMLGPRWAAFEVARQKVASGAAGLLLEPAMAGAIAFSDLARVYRRAFLHTWLDAVVRERPALLTFHSMTHEQRVSEFRKLDKRVLQENQHALISALRRSTQERLQLDQAKWTCSATPHAAAG